MSIFIIHEEARAKHDLKNKKTVFKISRYGGSPGGYAAHRPGYGGGGHKWKREAEPGTEHSFFLLVIQCDAIRWEQLEN